MPRLAVVSRLSPLEPSACGAPPRRVHRPQCQRLHMSRSPLQPPRKARHRSGRPRGEPASLTWLGCRRAVMRDFRRRQQRTQTLQTRALQA